MARKKHFPIGVDLGYSSAKFVQLCAIGDQLGLLAVENINIPEHLRTDQLGHLNHLSRKIPDLIRDNDFKGKKCVVALPASIAFVRHLRIGHMPPEKVAEAVKKAAKVQLPYPVEEAVIRHISVGHVYADGRKQDEVIMIAMPRATLDAFIEVLHDAKLEVIGVGVEPLALVSCYSRFINDPDESYVILDLGSSSIQATIATGTKVMFYRSVQGGGDQLNQAIAQSLKTSASEVQLMRQAISQNRDMGEKGEEISRWLKLWIDGIAEDIDNCLRYFESLFRDAEISRLIFTGGQARDTALCRQLAERLALPAQIGDPMVLISSGQDKASGNQLHTDLAVGIGLGLGANE